MKIKRSVRIVVFIAFWLVHFILLSSYLYAEESTSSPTLSEVQKRHIKKQVQDAIRIADKTFKKGQYADSFRILFDAHNEEKNARFPRDAYSKIYDKILYLIHEDQSPLLQLLREPDYPIQEKNKIFSELKTIAEKDVFNYENGWLFRDKYRGSLVQIMISQLLTEEEKISILKNIMHIVQDKYTSAAQKERVLEQSAQLVTLAEQKFNEKQYPEAFRIIWDNVKLESDSGISSEKGYAYHHLRASLEFLLHQDNSPLMVFFRNSEISLQKKKYLFSELRDLAKGHPLKTDSLLAREKYEGTLVQLMSSLKLTESEKLDMLGYIQDGIEKEYSPTP